MDWIRSQEALLWWLFAGSAVMFLCTPAAVGWVIIRLPVDYFNSRRRLASAWWKDHPLLRLVMLVAKNALGIVLILAGLVMLVIPGQGLLTIVVGLILVDFPGKFQMERWLVTRPPVWRGINWLRRRAGRKPLEQPEGCEIF